jgi:hypothetical protein
MVTSLHETENTTWQVLCSSGIKIFNNLLQSIKNLSKNPKQFKSALKNYLYAPSFYCVEEYLNVNTE